MGTSRENGLGAGSAAAALTEGFKKGTLNPATKPDLTNALRVILRTGR